jgi:hypothetical protein
LPPEKSVRANIVFFVTAIMPGTVARPKNWSEPAYIPTIDHTMVELHTPVFVYEPRETPSVDFDTLGRFRLHFIAADGSSIFVRMDRQMLQDLKQQIAEAVERT